MSNLPHPLGDSTAGDLFYPGSPDVIAADIPGAQGSRAVEFGEDGQSAAVNRGLYALGKNDEYQEARLEQTYPMPSLVSFTPSGGNGGSYTFSGTNVFVGFSGWLPETQLVRNSLITVLDQNYNELLSVGGISGYRVVVKEILDAPAGSSVVGGDFQTNPHVTFRLVHPVTGSPSADYTIPDGTPVYLSFGKQATLDELVGSLADEVRASWFLEHNRIGLHAGAFLHDGSRFATGDFDMAANGLLGVGAIWNYPPADLPISASGGTGADLKMSATGEIQFDDRWLSSWANLSQSGHTSLWGVQNNSIIGMLNSGNLIDMSLRDDWYDTNVCSVWGASISFNGTSGQIDWGSFDYIKNGEIVNIAAGNLTPTGDSNRLLVVRSGSVQDVANITDEDLVLYAFHFDSSEAPNGYTNVNGYNRDLRRHLKGRVNNLEVTVSNGVCADFRDLQTALDYVHYVGKWVGGTLIPGSPKIKIVGAYSTSSELQVRCPVTIEGEDSETCVVTTTHITTDYGIDCNEHKVDIRNLTFRPNYISADGVGLFANPGTGSKFKDLVIKEASSGYVYTYIFDHTPAAAIHYWMRFDNITTPDLFNPGCGGFIKSSHYLEDSIITNCMIVCKSSIGVQCIEALGSANKFLHNGFLLISDPGCSIGNNSLFHDNFLWGASSGDSLIQIARPTGHGTGEHLTKITNNYLWNGDEAIAVDGLVPNSIDLELQIHGNTFQDVYDCVRCDVSAAKLTAYASIRMTDNAAITVSSYFFYGTEIPNTFIRGNYMKDVSWPVSLNSGCARSVITDNIMYDINSGGYLIAWNNQGVSTSEYFKFANNFVKLSASGGATVLWLTGWNAHIEGNVFDRSATAAYWIDSVSARGHKIRGNYFGETTGHSVRYQNFNEENQSQERGFVISENHFEGAPLNYAACLVEGFTVSVLNNTFCPTDLGSAVGSAIIVVSYKKVTVEFTPHGSIVEGNFISNYEGRGPIPIIGSPSVVYVGNHGYVVQVRDFVVNGNSFFGCGTTEASLAWLSMLTFLGGGSICGNTMAWNKFPANGSASGFHIWLSSGPHNVTGNTIFLDFEFGSPTTGTQYGISCGIADLVCGNYIDFQGDNSAGPGATDVICIDGHNECLVIGNYTGNLNMAISWDSIFVGYNYVSVIGNYSIAGQISLSGCNSASLCIGNNGQQDSTDAGLAATSGNI